MKRFLIFLTVLAVVIAAAACAFIWERANFIAPGPGAPKGHQTVVPIAPGTGLSGISKTLAAAGVVRNANLFTAGVLIRGESAQMKAGEYAVPAKASMSEIAALLISGKVMQHKITIAEGLTSQMVYNLVKADPALMGDGGAVPPEGSLLPETYLFAHGMTRARLLARMHRARTRLLDGLWRTRATDLPFLNREQAIVMASIVEKETSIPAERRHIAAVFINRLKQGMKLQSDPTIIYGITRGYPLGRPIMESEIAQPTPYNTYVIAGLPPAPICNPGKDSIAAVLNPAQSADLYFVANGAGGHDFAQTIAQHQKNVARWRKIEQNQTPLPQPQLRR